LIPVRRPLPLLLGLALLAGGGLAGGCGADGGSEREKSAGYTERMQAAGKQYQQALATVDDAPDGEKLDDIAADLQQVERRLEAIEPPAKVQKAHRKLADGVEALAAHLQSATFRELAVDPTEAVLDLAQSPAAKLIGDARSSLAELGYEKASSAFASAEVDVTEADQRAAEKELEDGIDDGLGGF
jgi:hypothetical protein